MINESVGENIRHFREKRGMTQEDLALPLNVTRQTVSQWERQRAYPDIEMLKRIAAVLDVGILSLIYGHEEPQPDYGAFPSRAQKYIFYFVLALTLAGYFLPWFSFNPGVMGYRYGSALLFYHAIPLLAIVQMTRLRLSRRWDIGVAVLLLVQPVSCVLRLFTWQYHAFIASERFSLIDWEFVRETAYPGYYLSLVLFCLPLLLYPLCRREFSREERE